MAATAWKGAVTVTLNGVEVPIHVRLHNRVKSRSGDSFKTLAPSDQQPVRSVYLDSAGNEVDRKAALKGVEVSKGTFKPLPAEAVEAIGSAEKSTVVEPRQFCPADSIPVELAVTSYAVRPDKDVAGAERSVNQLWNGLLDSGLSYVTEITMKAGARDAILVLRATDEGLSAIALPYTAELADVPEFDWQRDEQIGQAVGAALTEGMKATAFDHASFESSWRKRRQAAIDAVLTGKTPEIPEAPAPAADAPDLMGALEASVKQAKPKKAPAKAKSRKKVAA